MTIGVFAFLAIVLFMIHEFEEIIFVRTWIKSRTGEKSGDMWTNNSAAYPSTATIAYMIAEEFIVASAVLLVAILLHLPEVALAILVAHGLHLVVHLVDAVRSHSWSPGSVTAITTLPPIIAVIWIFIADSDVNYIWLGICTVVVAILIIANLRLLHRLAPKIDNYIRSQAYRPK